VHLLFDSTATAIIARAVLGVIGAGAIAAGGYVTRALTSSGAIATVVVGTLCFAFGGPVIAVALVLFFAGGSLLSRIDNARAGKARAKPAKQGERDAAQVLANGTVATVCALLAGLAAISGHHSNRWLASAVGAIAAASGDTWSTEVGSLLGRWPRCVTNLKRVEPGTSGGITLAGTLAAPAGGAVVGLAGLFSPHWALGSWVATAALAGLFGSVVDSIAGATVQSTWSCAQCGQVNESARHADCRCDGALVRGWHCIDNDVVNVLATICGAALGYAAASVTQLTP
jgi:uncharacterized protein (TIGR00297 family)